MKLIKIISVLFFVVVWIILIGREVGFFSFLNRKIGFARRGINLTVGHCDAAQEGFERRLMTQKMRLFVVQGFLYFFAALFAAFILYILVAPFGAIYFGVGLIILFLVLIFTHTNANARYLMKLSLTTPCPRCGKIPMDYVARSKDERRLLVCNQCRTEWDLGSSAL
ncbi:MAG: hypothetical protein WAX69_02610 [Victivallales bacterium]